MKGNSSKFLALLLSASMLRCRLEIYPMLVALSPSVWRKD